MSYKDQRKELGLPPAGSLAPMNSTFDGSKWSHGVDAASIGKLGKLAVEINKVTDDTAEAVARAQIKVGRLLNEARELIPGDLQFGKWREANTNITNKSTANKLMNLATQVGSGRITQELLDALPMSTLKELISAPDSVVTAAIRMVVEEDKPPTRDQIRAMSREEKAPGGTEEPREVEPATNARPEPKPAPTMAPRSPATPPRQDVRAEQTKLIELTTLDRLRALREFTPMKPYAGCKPLEWAWLVLGLDPDPSMLPNKNTLEFVVRGIDNEMTGQKDEEELGNTLIRANELILKEEY